MRIGAVQYAKTLYEITKGKSQSEIDEVILGFSRMLVKNRQAKKLRKIIDRFSEIYNENENILEAQVETREKISEDIMTRIEKMLKEKYQARKVILNNVINKDVIGGVKIKADDRVLDFTVSGKLEKLKRSL